MRVKLLHQCAKLPTKTYETDAGWDLFSNDPHQLFYGNIVAIKTGIAIEIPHGCVGIIKDRSSMALKGVKVLGGVIDSGYTGEIIVFLVKISTQDTPIIIHSYDKIAQLLILPMIMMGNHLEVVDNLSESARGNKGFGSSDGNDFHEQIQNEIQDETDYMNSEGGIKYKE